MDQLVEQIANLLPSTDEGTKKELEKQVIAIKKISDSVLDEWLRFEESMVSKIGVHFPHVLKQPMFDDLQGMLVPELPLVKESKQPIQGISDSAPITKEEFYKAKGYFDLGLYQDSYTLLNEIIKKDPDYEFARLYLAYSAFFISQKEIAMHHLNLLKSSTANTKIRAVCNNALGILHFDEMKYENATRFFKEALKEDQNLFVSYYNLGMTHYMEGSYREAIQMWETYLSLTHDPDLEVVFHLSNCYLRLGQYTTALEIVKSLLPQNQNQTFLQLGKFFEDAKQYEEASLCYENILKLNPGNSEAIHGLAWNRWLINNQDSQCILLLKKALSLDKDNTNIFFSLAWIYFHQNNIPAAKKITDWLSKNEEASPLIITLTLLIALRQDDKILVEAQIQQLQDQKDLKSRALGELFSGKLKLTQSHFQEAIDSFKRSIRNNPQLKESYILQGVAHYLSHENEKAVSLLKKAQT